MSNTNADIVWRIAEFLPSNPIVYCKLALVNRTFYHVFTSDRVWRKLNPYGASENIIKTFYKACGQNPAEYGLLSLFWRQPSNWEPEMVRKFTQNQYAWLGYLLLCCTKNSWEGFEIYPHLVKSVLDVDPSQFMWTSNTLRERYEYSLHAVKRLSSNYRFIPEEFESDQVLSDLAIEGGYLEALQYKENFHDAEDIIRAAILDDPASVGWLSLSDHPLLLKDRDVMLKAVTAYPFALMDNPQYNDDFEICMLAVTAKPFEAMLESVSTRLRDSFELVLAAVKANGTNVAHASKRLRKQHCIKLAAIQNWRPKQPGNRILKIFELYDRDELADIEIIKALVSHHGLMLGELAYKDNYDVAMFAVKNNGKAIAHASDTLKQNKSLALAAVTQCAFAYQYIGVDLRDDPDVLRAMVQQDGTSLRAIPTELHDRELVLLALENTGRAYEYCEFQDDKEITEIAVRKWFPAYSLASSQLQGDKDIVFAAFANHRGDHLEIPPELLSDLEFMEPLIKRNGTRLPSLLDHRKFALLSVAANSKYYRDLPKKYKEDLAFNIEAVKMNAEVFNELEIEFCLDTKVQAAIR